MREGRVWGGWGGGGEYDSVSSVTFDPEENKMRNEGSRLELTYLYLFSLIAHTETYLALIPGFPWKQSSPDGIARETAEREKERQKNKLADTGVLCTARFPFFLIQN